MNDPDVKYGDMLEADEEFKAAFETGWTIVEVGQTYEYTDSSYQNPTRPRSVEGGLTFILEKENVRKKIILGYTELGAWIEHVSMLKPT